MKTTTNIVERRTPAGNTRCKKPNWYRKAFAEFKEDGEKHLLYASSYQVNK